MKENGHSAQEAQCKPTWWSCHGKRFGRILFILGMALSGSAVFMLPRFNLCTHDCGGSLPTEVEQSPNTVPDSTGEETLTEVPSLGSLCPVCDRERADFLSLSGPSCLFLPLFHSRSFRDSFFSLSLGCVASVENVFVDLCRTIQFSRLIMPASKPQTLWATDQTGSVWKEVICFVCPGAEWRGASPWLVGCGGRQHAVTQKKTYVRNTRCLRLQPTRLVVCVKRCDSGVTLLYDQFWPSFQS